MKSLIIHARNFYGRFERPISSLSLIGGFVFDAVALRRVDQFWENFWVVVHLGIVAVCIILIHREENEAMDAKDPARAHFWFINILQFFFGGLLSTFLVFYFRSATLSVSWPFLLILALAFIANERLKHHYARLTFQISLFFLSLFSFAIFIVPVMFHRIGADIFLLSGFGSLAALAVFLLCLAFFSREKFKKSKNMLFLSVIGIFIGVNLLYFFNIIPPIPLSLKDAGVYHSLSRDDSGNYLAQAEQTTGFEQLLGYFSVTDEFHEVAGDPVYAYSAVFSPTAFNTDIVHEWQFYDAATRKWTTVNRVHLSVIGGRDGGYRTYSIKENVMPGAWRVNVETESGQIIGRLRFDVIAADTEPALTTEVKD